MSEEINKQNNAEVRVPQWTPIQMVTEEEAFEAYLMRNHPREAAVKQQMKLDRRSFMKLMGASLAMAGFGITGCAARPPEEPIIPYVRLPEEMIPGKPLYFASSMVLGGYATGLLIETHEGRPTRVEGNPNHPASLGAGNAFLLASVLELYNPQRSLKVLRNAEESTWQDFVQVAQSTVRNGGAGIRILTETITSPTLAQQINTFLESHPDAKWYQYEPVSRDNVTAGSQLAFDEVVNTVYHFDQADVVLALDADFLSMMPGSLRYAHDFMAKRNAYKDEAGASMNRLYAVESTPTITGATADHRLALPPSQVEGFARALAGELGIEANGAAGSWNATWFAAVVADLRDHAGSSIVIAGAEQPPIVHALAHAINAELGNIGNTITYTDPVEANPVIQADDLAALAAELEANAVNALFILGGNPAYNAPVDLNFANAISNVPFSVHLAPYFDETSIVTQWHIAQTHYVEEWGDARAYDGTASIVQPPIGPLYDTVHSAYEVLAVLNGDNRSPYEMIRTYWQENYTGDDFEMFWRRSLHDGVIADTAFEAKEVSLRGDFAAQIADIAPASASGLEVVFRPDSSVWDGRFASNSWLQELPKPLTKITWDNAALLSQATADSLGVASEDLIELSFGGNTMQAPVWVIPGHPDNTVTVNLGYGRGFGADVDAGVYSNAYAIRTLANPWFGSGASIRATGDTYKIATVRGKIDIEDTSPLKHATFAEFMANPDFAYDDYKYPESTLYSDFEYDSYAWGMSIDLTSCIGCNACIMGCQTENNIPTVGKQAVAQGREMHWLRIDRYYMGEGEEMNTAFQPVPCMHCENAPCEQVCPVAATVHDSEGLNNMVYNRCIGTRYCSANCPYSVRRFNFLQYVEEEPIHQEWRNPDVSVRVEGVMEKCSYCVQRINAARITAKNEGRSIMDGEVVPACASACPTKAITFGDINNPNAAVTALKAQPHNYDMLGELNTKPRTSYLARLNNPNGALTSTEGEE